MADRKISDLTALTTPASGDFLPIVDISEAAAASKNKRITIEELFRGVPLGTAAAPSIAIEGNENTGVFSPGANQLAVATNGTEVLRITSTGQVRLAGAGITFNGDTAAANELDDYEEGTWTPNQGAGLTVVGTFSSVGRYTKVGNLVYVTGYVSGSTSIAITAGSILCSNLIFTQGIDGCGGNCTNYSVNQTSGLFATGGSTNLYATSALTASGAIVFGFTFRV
jgi:hypothetical protein